MSGPGLGRFLAVWLPLGVGLGLLMWSWRRWRRSRRRWRRRVLRLAALARLARLAGWLPFLVLVLVLVFGVSSVDAQEPTSTSFLGPTFTPSPPVAFTPGPTDLPGGGDSVPPWMSTPTPEEWIPGVNCVNATSTPVGYAFPTFQVSPYPIFSPTPGVQITPCWDNACITGGWTGATPECCQFGLTATPTPTPFGVTSSDVVHAGCALIECYNQPASDCNPEPLEWCRVFGAESWDGQQTLSGNTGAYCESGSIEQTVDGVFVDLVGEHADFNLVLSAVDSFTNSCDVDAGGQSWVVGVLHGGGSDLCGGPGNDEASEAVAPFPGIGTCTVETRVTLVRNNPGCPPYNALCCNHASGRVFVRARRVADDIDEAVHYSDTLTEPGTYFYGPTEIQGDLYSAIVLTANWYGFTPGTIEGVTTVTCGGSTSVVEVSVDVVDTSAVHYVCVDSANALADLEVWAASDYTLDVVEFDAAYKPPTSEGFMGWMAWPWNLGTGYFERFWSSADAQPLEGFADDFGLDPGRCFEVVQQVSPPGGELKSRDWRDYPVERPTLPSGYVDKFPWSFVVCHQGTEKVNGFPVPPGCLEQAQLPLCPGSSNPLDNVIEIIEGDCYVFLPEFDFSVNLSFLGFGEIGIDTPGIQVCVDYVKVNHEVAGWNFGDIFSTVTLAALAGVIVKLFRDA